MRKIIFMFFVFYNCKLFSQDVGDITIYNTSSFSLSENSVFISPLNDGTVLNANNHHDNACAGNVDGFYSTDNGQNWSSPIAFSNSIFDPATAIDKNGYLYVTYITNYFTGQLYISQSTDGGTTWGNYPIASGTDKEHLWVDNSLYKSDGSSNSSYQGNLYTAWHGGGIYFSHSTDQGVNWDATPKLIGTSSANTGTYYGANIQTGPSGEVYVCWADDSTISSTSRIYSILLNKSTDGGNTWNGEKRIKSNIYGIPITTAGLGGGKTMRSTSWPVMTINKQNGYIFVVWSNKGVPGTNTGNYDIYMIKSTDGGSTWSSATKVNTDASNTTDQWFPWIACDEASGVLVCTYYDSRNFGSNDGADTYVSISYDQGGTWADTKISDYNWPGDVFCGTKYAGDYIGVDVHHGKAIAIWTDKHSPNTNLLAYANPFPVSCPSSLSLTYGNYSISDETNNSNYDAAYSTSGTIDVAGSTSNYKIYSGANVLMTAPTSITLNQGFECNGEFTADIASCPGTGFSQRTSNNNTQPPETKIIEWNPSFATNSQKILLYPNPSKGLFSILVPMPDEKKHEGIVSVYNMLGSLVYRSNMDALTPTQINISSQPTGIYIVNVTIGNNFYSEKLILSHYQNFSKTTESDE